MILCQIAVWYVHCFRHSPFRSRDAKNKEEIDKMTLEKEVSFSSEMSVEMKELLGGLLVKDPGARLACRGRG